MKKTILITALFAAISLNSHSANATASKEQNVGFFSGAIAGFGVAGPIGFIFGGAAGALLGNQVEKANQLEGAKQAILNLEQANAQLEAQLSAAKLPATQSDAEDLTLQTPMMMQGLTLNLMFVTDSANLSTEDHKVIIRISKLLQQYPELKIRLDGYADPRGEENYNQTLSESRAINVQQAFQSNGINSDRLIVIAHGESQTEVDIEDQDALAMERRVSINFITSEIPSVAQNSHY
ncbi:MAG: OmpA family protein [Enterobacterales bacterium]|nr:OmpA family protein [Enterobacterales bacterium]